MLGYDCDCSCDDGEPCRTSQTHYRKARKTWTCDECRGEIQPRERYEHVHGISGEGTAFDHRTCLGCQRIRERFCPHGYILGAVRDHVSECLGFDYASDPTTWDQADVDAEDEANRIRVLAEKGGTDD